MLTLETNSEKSVRLQKAMAESEAAYGSAFAQLQAKTNQRDQLASAGRVAEAAQLGPVIEAEEIHCAALHKQFSQDQQAYYAHEERVSREKAANDACADVSRLNSLISGSRESLDLMNSQYAGLPSRIAMEQARLNELLRQLSAAKEKQAQLEPEPAYA